MCPGLRDIIVHTRDHLLPLDLLVTVIIKPLAGETKVVIIIETYLDCIARGKIQDMKFRNLYCNKFWILNRMFI